MFNVTVLKMRDIVKYLVGFMIIIGIIVYATRFFAYKAENKEDKIKSSWLEKTKIEEKNDKSENDKSENVKMQSILMWNLTSCLDKTIPAMASTNEEYKKIEKENKEINNKISNKNYLEEFLKTEISTIKGIEEIERENITVTDKTSVASNSDSSKEDSNDSNSNEDNKQESEKITLASQDSVKTKVVTPNPISENANVQYEKVKIKNQTTYNLTEDILNPNISIDNKNVLIFHTHSCESYTSSEKYSYSQTGNYRTTDMNFTVTRVGTELENYLKQYNINVIHDKSYHDYPSYTGSYTRSLKTVENILKTTPSDIIIDLHRDAVGSRPDYAPTVKIGDDYAAQIMFVIGTNEGGLWHPNWQQNLKFAVKVQQKAEEMYPGLFKPIMLTKSRYNQHTGKYANIIEVGATGNTLEQCLTSMKYLSAVMNEVMK